MSVRITRTMNDNLTRLDLGRLTLWFSYETVVAYQARGELRVSENVWSNTTARHLAQLDGGGKAGAKTRIPRQQFVAELDALLTRIGVAIREELWADA